MSEVARIRYLVVESVRIVSISVRLGEFKEDIRIRELRGVDQLCVVHYFRIALRGSCTCLAAGLEKNSQLNRNYHDFGWRFVQVQ